MLRSDVENVINKNPGIFKYFKILGSYSRNSPEINDLDLLFDKKNFLKIKSLRDKGLEIRIIQVNDHIVTVRGRISRILFEAYGIDKKYFPSASLLIRGPRDRYHQLKADAEAHGYYLTHFGLLPIEEALSSNLQERACFESDKKILFNDEDLYESFFRSQPIEGIKRELGSI